MSASNSIKPFSHEVVSQSEWPADAAQRIEAALQSLDRWLGVHQYTGYDPFDGLSSFLRPLTFGTKFGRQLLLQLVKRSPFNLRPWIGVRPATSSKGMAFLARGYLRWSRLQPGNKMQNKAQHCLSWLRGHASSGYAGRCWGNHFDYQARLFYLPAGAPTAVWSSLIGQAFLDAFETLGDVDYLEEASAVSRFIVNHLPRHQDDTGTCISYVPNANIPVHNANALAAALLTRVYHHTREDELLRIAAESLAYTAGHQNDDGSWFYGEQANLHWIDNWHTAYVLDSFLDYAQATGDQRFHSACLRGWRFYRDHFFLQDGVPKYYCNRTYPVDIQSASQSIETLCRFRVWDPDALSLAVRVALWTIENMQDATGFFYFQRHPWYVNRAAHLHWGQATMLSALSLLLLNLNYETGE